MIIGFGDQCWIHHLWKPVRVIGTRCACFHWFYRAAILFQYMLSVILPIFPMIIFPTGNLRQPTGIPAHSPAQAICSWHCQRCPVPRCCSETVTGDSKLLGMVGISIGMSDIIHGWQLGTGLDIQTIPATWNDRWLAKGAGFSSSRSLLPIVQSHAVTFALQTVHDCTVLICPYVIMRISVLYNFPTFTLSRLA